jgi:hypothetical protein
MELAAPEEIGTTERRKPAEKENILLFMGFIISYNWEYTRV